MRKTIKDMAKHLRILIPEVIPRKYSINSRFFEISCEENIFKGILAFRDFLYRLCDVLILESDLYDDFKKIAHPYENRITISLSYPFLNNIKQILLNIGYHGELQEKADTLTCKSSIFYEKISDSKNLECLRFLTKCGLQIDGININEKKQKLSDLKILKITNPENFNMLIGLKVMAIAEKELGIKYCDILLRCDYRVLGKNKTDVLSILKETIKPLSVKVQNFILRLHQIHLDNGLNCEVVIKDFWIKVMYSYKKKELWGINLSLNNGFEITVKAVNTNKYIDTIKKFPIRLQKIIAKGYGCGRKRNADGVCDGGCKGLCIPLDDSVLNISESIEIWFNKELSCYNKKQ